MKLFFEKHFEVYQPERADFLKLAVLFLVVYFFFAIFRNYVDASFLKRYGPGGIPLMLCVSGALSIAMYSLLRRLGQKASDKTILTCYFLLAALAQAILYPLAKAGYSAAYPVLFVLLSLMDSFLLVYLWNVVQSVFDARQGKRLFRLLMAGQVLGTTLGNLASAPTVEILGPDSALLVCAGANIILALTSIKVRLGGYIIRPSSGDSRGPLVYKAFEAFGRYPIFRFLCICAVIPNLILPILTYQFGMVVTSAFPSEQELLVFLSWFRGGMTLSIFVCITLLGRVYSKLPLRAIAQAPPINQCLAFGALALFFNLKAAAYAQFSSILLQRAAMGPLTKQLFALLPRDISAWAQVFARGTLTQVSALGGAVIVFSLKGELPPREMSFLALALALVWTFEGVKFWRSYGVGLKQVITGNAFDFDRIDTVVSGLSAEPAGREPVIEPDEYPEEMFKLLAEMDIPEIDPEKALADLASLDESLRAEAAASFALSRDFRAVGGLIKLLDDSEPVRRASIDAISRYGPGILPVLELALAGRSARAQRGILEALRLARARDADLIPFLGPKLTEIYNGLIAARSLEASDGGSVVSLLVVHLREKAREDLYLVFLALWVVHRDMRSLFEALNSHEASAVAELLETSLDPWTAERIVPLVDSIPEEETVARGRRVLPLMRGNSPVRVLAGLCADADPVNRLLAFCAVGESFPGQELLPAVQAGLREKEPDLRQAALFAYERCRHREVEMPSVIKQVQSLHRFHIFSGLGIRELRAVASIAQQAALAAGTVVVRSGEAFPGLYLVIGGSVAKRDSHGGEVKEFEAGGLFGVFGLFMDQLADTEYVVTRDAELFIIKTTSFLEMMKLYPLIGVNMCRYFSELLRSMDCADAG